MEPPVIPVYVEFVVIFNSISNSGLVTGLPPLKAGTTSLTFLPVFVFKVYPPPAAVEVSTSALPA